MSRRRAIGLAAALLLALPGAAAGESYYSYVDADGVLHISNVPSDSRYRKVTRKSDPGGLYRQGRRVASATGQPVPGEERHGKWAGHVRECASRYNLPEALLLAVMAAESNFDPRALSEKGAMGLMQLMPATARELYVSDAWDPAQNIEGGARYLRILANQYSGDMMKTLAAYNAGPEAVRRAGEAVPQIPETQEYVRKVMALYHSYKAGR
jgi:soluble lytic murein transglycosylase-like protein